MRILFDLRETDTGADVEHVVGQRNAYYRLSLPTLVNGAQAHEGR